MRAPSAGTAKRSSGPKTSRRPSSARRLPGKPAIIELKIDPDAITPATTLSAIREKARKSKLT